MFADPIKVSQINEINRLIIIVNELTDEGGSCEVKTALTFCSSIAFYGRPYNHLEIMKLCAALSLVEVKDDTIRLSQDGIFFLSLNSDSFYETTEEQNNWLARNVILSGYGKEYSRNLLRLFSPNYKLETFELYTSPSDLPDGLARTMNVLTHLGVLNKMEGGWRVKDKYVDLIKDLLLKKDFLSEQDFENILAWKKQFGKIAEHAVVEFERTRLGSLNRVAESELVRRISHLNVSAGYDIESFEGKVASIYHNRFIEVKASVSENIHFYWSANEMSVAKVLGDQYWIYFIPNFIPSEADKIQPVMIQNPLKSINESSGLILECHNFIINQYGDLELTSESIGSVKWEVL